MKNQIKNMLLLIAVMFTIGCAKEDTSTPNGNSVTKLSKITSWNPTSGIEINNLELTYNATGVITSAIGTNGDSFAFEFDAAGKLSKVIKSNPNGRNSTSVYEYNSAGRISKINVVHSGNNTNVYTYEYNAAGKMSKKTVTYLAGSATSEYTWVGDNISEVKLTTMPGSFVFTIRYTSYDDKNNPYSLGGDFVAFGYLDNPPSKNNVLEMSITPSSGAVTTEKRIYEYNTLGYATSMKLMGSSNEGQKYYYK